MLRFLSLPQLSDRCFFKIEFKFFTFHYFLGVLGQKITLLKKIAQVQK